MQRLFAKYQDYLLLMLCAVSLAVPTSFSIHPFEVPDENAHYATLHFLYSQGRMPTVQDKHNLSLEELKTEEVFGIVEHQNKYSYHPEYRVEYIAGTVGKYEPYIASINTEDNRSTYMTKQAAIYPPLYYWLALPFYSLAKSSDILGRVFASRFASIILTVATVLVALAVGKLLFRERYLSWALATTVLLYPMTLYIGSGVNSDNLHNILFGMATLLFLRLIRDGWSKGLAVSIGLVIALDLITKPQGYILFPIFALAALLRFKWEWKQWIKHFFLIAAPILLLAGWHELPKFISGNVYATTGYTYTGPEHFRNFAAGYIRTHLTEMSVWYWGVFKWFGIVLPKPWWWIATRLLGLSGLGLLLYFYQEIRRRKIGTATRYILFFVGANVIYIGALFWFDWQFYQQFGRSLGLQARYYMPLLITQMSLLLMGISNLGWNSQVKVLLARGLVLFFIGLQLASIYTQVSSYYDVWPLQGLFEQISQYKPFFAKGSWWYLWIVTYLTGIIALVHFNFSLDRKKK